MGAQHTPTLVDLARARIEGAGPRDKTINIKIAINTARMIVDQERNSRAALIEALTAIADAHVPDQPAESPCDERAWVMQHVGKLRLIAMTALNLAGAA